jgi:hypothetical protein
LPVRTLPTYAPPQLMHAHPCTPLLSVLAFPIHARLPYPCSPSLSVLAFPIRACPLAHMRLSFLCPNHSKFLTTSLPSTYAPPLSTCARPVEYVCTRLGPVRFLLDPCTSLLDPYAPLLDTYASSLNTYVPPFDPYMPLFDPCAPYIAVRAAHPIRTGSYMSLPPCGNPTHFCLCHVDLQY